MNIRLAYAALLFFCSCLLWSQTTKLAKAPEVTAKDLIEKKHPTDTTAVAAYQYHYGNTYFDLVDNYWVMVTEVYNRIKIYKKEGYKYADSKIVFYSGSRKGKGSVYEAATYNLENGVVTKTPLGTEGIAEDEPVEDYTRKKIKMPNVKEGSIIEYKYKIRTPYFTNLEDFYFQYDIPVDNVRYDVAVPGYFIYNVYTVGYADIQKDEVFVRDNYQLECKELVYKYAAKNVKALPDEPYVNNPDNYTAMIKHELATVSLPNRSVENYATDWKNVAKNIYGMDGFGRELKQSSYFEKDIDPVLAQAKTDEEKMNAVFTYVQDRMAWNDKSSYRCKEGVKKAYESRTGNVAEINLMLTAMLRYAGLDANPVLTSTRDNGIAVFPTRTAYNYVITSVKIADKQYLLDATSKYTAPNILPVRTLNWNGRLIKKNGDTEDVSLMNSKLGKETASIQCEMDNKGGIKGKYK
ncbi:MAG: transglutaminase domain-containing protein, partial [Flavobacterium sp.]